MKTGGRGQVTNSPLRFRSDGSFVIAQFTDLHWKNGEPEDQQTRALMEQVLAIEQPDLAVLTGDVLAGQACQDPEWAWRQAVRPLEEAGLPWAAVFGNHDDEGSLSRAALMAVQQSCRGCLSQPGPADITGVGNYVLLIEPQAGTAPQADVAGSPTAQAASPPTPPSVLYFLDSNSYAPKQIGGYAWFAADQIAWYRRTAADLATRYGSRLPALAFFHIPLPEYNEVWDQHLCVGHKYEAVCCPRINSGMFAAFLEMGDVMGTFVGHDHVNDFRGSLYGIELCYGRAGGYATYGREGFARGARLIRLHEGKRTFDSWLRLEGGVRVAEQPVHEPAGRVLSA